MNPNGVLVAVFEISDDANEDRWADATWQAELAARDAAVATGAGANDIVLTRGMSNVVAALPDGREFEARVATTAAALASYSLPGRGDLDGR